MDTQELRCPKCRQPIQQTDRVCPFCHYVLDATIMESGLGGEDLLNKQTTSKEDKISPSQPTVITQGDVNPSQVTVITASSPASPPTTKLEQPQPYSPNILSAQTMKMMDFADTGHPDMGQTELRREAEQPQETLRREESSMIGLMFGRCKVIEKLGQGGMGTVYKAYHQTLDQNVVLKVLPAALARSAEFRERFTREARACAKLYHQNVVQVLDAGYENGVYFYLMEFVDGSSLEDLLTHGKRFSVQEACQIIRDTAIGLEMAHKQGIIHRDIKPSNIMLTKTSIVKVADFGLACNLGAERISLPGQMMGTPHYMSPEQWDGVGVEERSDLYSLGITFYFLLTGQVPFSGTTPVAILKKHAMEKPPPLSKFNKAIPPAVEAIVLKLMAKNKEDRYADARELITALDNFLQGTTATPGHHHSLLTFAVAATILLAIGTGGTVWFLIERSKANQESSAQSKTVKRPQTSVPIAATRPDLPTPTPKVEVPKPQPPDAPKPVTPTLPETTPSPIGKEPLAVVSRPKEPPAVVKAQVPVLPVPRIHGSIEKTVTALPFTISGVLSETLPAASCVKIQIRLGSEDVTELAAHTEQRKFYAVVKNLPDGKYQLIPAVVYQSTEQTVAKKGNAVTMAVDVAPPLLDITSPQDKLIVDEQKVGQALPVTVKSTDACSGVQQVTLITANARIPMKKEPKNHYRASLPLRWGRQEYQVMAEDRAGHSTISTRTVSLVPKGMIRVPGGSFCIEKNTVSVRPFYIDRTEITNEAYDDYLSKTGARAPKKWPTAPGEKSPEWRRLPIVLVTHIEASAYAKFVGKRLPTKAEWTVAALADQDRLLDYPWGNHCENIDWPQELLPVGTWSKDKSPLGVCDMAGNVAEWTMDTVGNKAVRKGGYYLMKPTMLNRQKWADISQEEPQDIPSKWIGFRCALSEEQ